MASRYIRINHRSKSLARGRIPGCWPPLPAVGPYVTSADSGLLIAKKHAVKGRGGYVHRAFRFGERDRTP